MEPDAINEKGFFFFFPENCKLQWKLRNGLYAVFMGK